MSGMHTIGHMIVAWAACWLWWRIGKKEAMQRVEFDIGQHVLKHASRLEECSAYHGDIFATTLHFNVSIGGQHYRVIVHRPAITETEPCA